MKKERKKEVPEFFGLDIDGIVRLAVDVETDFRRCQRQRPDKRIMRVIDRSASISQRTVNCHEAEFKNH